MGNQAVMEIENPIVRMVRYTTLSPQILECECGESAAIMKVNGEPRCKWCAQDEGIELL